MPKQLNKVILAMVLGCFFSTQLNAQSLNFDRGYFLGESTSPAAFPTGQGQDFKEVFQEIKWSLEGLQPKQNLNKSKIKLNNKNFEKISFRWQLTRSNGINYDFSQLAYYFLSKSKQIEHYFLLEAVLATNNPKVLEELPGSLAHVSEQYPEMTALRTQYPGLELYRKHIRDNLYEYYLILRFSSDVHILIVEAFLTDDDFKIILADVKQDLLKMTQYEWERFPGQTDPSLIPPN